MSIQNRLKALRKELELNQTEFATRLSLKQATVSAMERGETAITDRTIRAICSEFNVSENWLRTGEGEMFEQLSRNQEIAREVNQVLRDEPESFRSRLIAALCRLDESDWEVLEKIAIQMAFPNEPPPHILPFAARDGIQAEIYETPEEKEKRRAETLRDLENIPDITLPDK